MSDETVNYIPEFDAVALLQQRLAAKKTEASSSGTSTGKPTIDPYKMMLGRRQQNAGEVISDQPVQVWPEEDIKKLEAFCSKHGIIGFNAGRMSPLAALCLLKQKLGIVDTPSQTEGYGPNYPYTDAIHKRRILHG